MRMRAIFLDRDGVINDNRVDHVKSWDEFHFLPGSLIALRWLRLAGFNVFVVTNQAIVNRGLASAQAIEDIHNRMLLQVALHGGHIHDIRYCPHDTHEHCRCRKPQPGMIQELAARWHVDLSRSYMIGDAWTDIEAGSAVNCKCVIVRTGRGAEQISLPEVHHRHVGYIAPDLMGAVEWLFEQEGLTPPYLEGTSLLRPGVAPHLPIALSVGG